MPKASRASASRVQDMGVLESRSEQLDGYTVEFSSFREDADATPFFRVSRMTAARARIGDT